MSDLANSLKARLRVGSVLTTRGGVMYRVIEPLVQVASNGGVVPTFLLEKTPRGSSPHSVLMSVGMLANLMRRGGRHKPGPGRAIDWTRVKRRAIVKETTVLRRRAS